MVPLIITMKYKHKAILPSVYNGVHVLCNQQLGNEHSSAGQFIALVPVHDSLNLMIAMTATIQAHPCVV